MVEILSESVYFVDMDKISKKKNYLRKATVIALAAAVALLVRGGIADRQASQLADNIPPAIVCALPEPADANVLSAEEPASRKERKSSLLQNILRVVTTLLSFVLPLILRVLTLAGKALFTPLLSPAAAAMAALAGDSLATFLLMVSMFSLLFKLTYPEKSLREFFTLRNLLMMLTAAAAVTLVLRFEPQRLSAELTQLIHIACAGSVTVLCAATVLRSPEKESAPAETGRST